MELSKENIKKAMVGENAKMPVKNKISDRIVQRASQLRISQAEIARKLGCNRSTVNAWFNGSSPRAEYMPGLRSILRVSQDWLEGISSLPVAKNELEMLAFLDRVWELKPNQNPSSSMVLLPTINQDCVIENSSPAAFMTSLLDHVEDKSGLIYWQSPGDGYVVDTHNLKPLSKEALFLVCVDGVEMIQSMIRRELSGSFAAVIDGQKVSLADHENVKIWGKVVCVTRRL